MKSIPKFLLLVASLWLGSMLSFAQTPKQSKIVGLVPVRNEAHCISTCLRALALYTDAIVVLDDASEDATVAVVESLAQECRVEKILKKTTWYRDEPGDRNWLLKTGREIGGTHFVVIDADEMFTANFQKNFLLHSLILRLNPGDRLKLNWIQLWASPNYYKFH